MFGKKDDYEPDTIQEKYKSGDLNTTFDSDMLLSTSEWDDNYFDTF